jgi:2-amino-4,5-dihydroxy-6-oxo-7-(phosphonooxy)heptanoate synthase
MNGKQAKLRRLFRHRADRLLVVPLDHSVSDGPLGRNDEFETLVKDITAFGTDAIVVHKGRVRHLPDQAFINSSIIVHLSASTRYARDPNEKVVVCAVEEALMRGADCISVHVNMGSQTEATQLRDMAAVANACERFGIPLLAMMYARGEGVEGVPRLQALAHAASLATDMGADLVKLALPNGVDDVRWVVSRCPLPVLAAGGSKVDEPAFLQYAENVIQGGAVGLAAGRNVFQANDVTAFIADIRSRIDDLPVRGRFHEGGFDPVGHVKSENYNARV